LYAPLFGALHSCAKFTPNTVSERFQTLEHIPIKAGMVGHFHGDKQEVSRVPSLTSFFPSFSRPDICDTTGLPYGFTLTILMCNSTTSSIDSTFHYNFVERFERRSTMSNMKSCMSSLAGMLKPAKVFESTSEK
jgi:hypothetical protein